MYALWCQPLISFHPPFITKFTFRLPTFNPPPHTCRYYREIHGAALLYDITDLNSYKKLDEWLTELRDRSCSNIVTMLVGNKCDLRQKQAVATTEAIAYAAKNSMLFCETSAKDGTGVEAAFHNFLTSQWRSCFHCICITYTWVARRTIWFGKGLENYNYMQYFKGEVELYFLLTRILLLATVIVKICKKLAVMLFTFCSNTRGF